MKDLKSLYGAIAAIITVVAVRYAIKRVGIENIPIKIQMIFLVLSPILIGIAIYKFSANSKISRYLIAAGIIFTVAVIMLILLMIIKQTYPQYFDIMRVPIGLIFIVLLFVAVIVMIAGLGKHPRR